MSILKALAEQQAQEQEQVETQFQALEMAENQSSERRIFRFCELINAEKTDLRERLAQLAAQKANALEQINARYSEPTTTETPNVEEGVVVDGLD